MGISSGVEVGLPKWNEYSPLDKGLTIGLATSIVIGMGVLAWVVQIPQPGEPFDPNRHQALMQQPSEFPEGSIVQTLQKGYALHDRTLRPAQVAVSKKG